MSLAPGVRLGAYEIVSLLGAGGMGEVYRARDTRLGRDVAIKVLPEAFAADPERIARFQREAQVLASLNHPNIAHIHGLEEGPAEARRYLRRALVLELVEGPTLADRIAQGPIPLDEALPIARQIAEALEAAHEHGIIHRDLKPANIKLTADGTMKVLDFGLAKALERSDVGRNFSSADLSVSPTITSPAMTLAGVILGTAAYMSPEQAKGRAADKRSDIWAFGCVLYEMLTGRPAFDGNEVSEVLAGVIKSDPAWDRLPVELPPAIRNVLRWCLHKDPRRRLRDIGDVRLALDGAFETPTGTTPVAVATLKLWQRPLPALLAAAVLITASSLAVWIVMSAGSTAPLTVQRLSINLPASAPYDGLGLALSPDGGRLVYSASIDGTRRLYMRSLDQLEPQLLPGTENGRQPFFSPDGEWVGFFSDGGGGPTQVKLQKVSMRGGPPQTLCEAPTPRGGWWGADGTIVFASGAAAFQVRLFRISANGGTPEPLAAANPPRVANPQQPAHWWPQILPGGKAVLFSARSTEIERLEVLSLDTGESRVIVENGYYGRYTLTGHLVYTSDATLMAVPFDIERLEVTGSPVSILEGVRTFFGGTSAALSTEGTLVYQPGVSERTANPGFGRVVAVTRDGRATAVGASRGLEAWPRLSPDDSQVALYAPVNPNGAQPGRGANADIWVYDLSRGTREPITREASQDDFPVWTPDGSRIVFHSTRMGAGDLFWQRLDRSGAAELLLRSETSKFPGSWSPDGQVLAFHQVTAQNQRDIWMLPSGGKPQPFLATPFNEVSPRFSPDGRWVAYVSDESGEREVYVQPYPGPGRRIPISTDGGEGPVWSHDGRELFYFRPQSPFAGRLMVVDIRTERAFSAGVPRLLFEGPYVTQSFGTPNYDVFRDGQRFVMIQHPNLSSSTDTPLVVVLNWFEELKRLAPTN